MRPDPEPGSRRIGPILGVLAIAYAVIGAASQAWLCDDAFISFRYADNLTHGLGLVYNAGERVEGYSNFLWTLWIALGMQLGIAPEPWSLAWGTIFYAGSIALLYWDHRRIAPPARAGVLPFVPLACLVAAAHPDWNVFATSGLETSMFTFLVLLGFLMAVHPMAGWRGLACSGLVFGLAAMTRPDGLLFAPLVALWVFWARRPAIRSVTAFIAAFALAWLPFVAWKISYYGDFFPNTYYAKSASLAWYEQGWIYLRLYFQKYWVLALAAPLGIVALGIRLLRRRERPAQGSEPSAADHRRQGATDRGTVLALALALAYTFYVARVGGDFMYARLLIPVTPLFLVALERAVLRLAARVPVAQAAAAAVAVAAVVVTPMPLKGKDAQAGIVNEREVYTAEVLARFQRSGLTLRRYFKGLPVRMAYVGSQASLAYYARPAVAIESQTGLTDRWIARQPIERRGRVGHEKIAPVSYLVDRRVHFVFRTFAVVTLGLDKVLPEARADFDTIPGRVVCWDPALMAELKRRGARFPDAPSQIDSFAAGLDAMTDAQVIDAYDRLRRFYFGHVRDPKREAPFLERLARIRR